MTVAIFRSQESVVIPTIDLSSLDLTSYSEKSEQLTSSSGTLIIPLNGKIFYINLTQNITTITTTIPTSPQLGNTIVFFNQGATGYSVAIPASWKWQDKLVVPVSTDANSQTRMILTQDPSGTIHVDVSYRGLYT